VDGCRQVGLKRDLVRVLGNLCYEDRASQVTDIVTGLF
jgi:hypothetical protein